jgi:hypothetical protein
MARAKYVDMGRSFNVVTEFKLGGRDFEDEARTCSGEFIRHHHCSSLSVPRCSPSLLFCICLADEECS